MEKRETRRTEVRFESRHSAIFLRSKTWSFRSQARNRLITLNCSSESFRFTIISNILVFDCAGLGAISHRASALTLSGSI